MGLAERIGPNTVTTTKATEWRISTDGGSITVRDEGGPDVTVQIKQRDVVTQVRMSKASWAMFCRETGEGVEVK